jgi:hypothetical protein
MPPESPLLAMLDAALEQLLDQRMVGERQEFVRREQEVARMMYRRGYLAGRNSKRRGDLAVSNPERLARGEARRLMLGASQEAV